MGIFVMTNHLIIFDLTTFDGFSKRRSTDRDSVKMQHACSPLDFIQYCRDAACTMNIFHVPFACRTHLGNVRNLIGHRIDAAQRIIHICFVRQSQRMKNRVGRTAHCHIQSKCIVNRFGSHHIAWLDVAFDESHDLRCGLFRQRFPFGCLCQRRAVERKGQSYHLHQAIHRVGREHAGA